MIGYQAISKNAPIGGMRKMSKPRMAGRGRPGSPGGSRNAHHSGHQMAHFDPGHNELIRKAQGLGGGAVKPKPKRKPGPKGIQKSVSGMYMTFYLIYTYRPYYNHNKFQT